jgi:hypothetical protein
VVRFGRTSCYAVLRDDHPALHTNPGNQRTTELLAEGFEPVEDDTPDTYFLCPTSSTYCPETCAVIVAAAKALSGAACTDLAATMLAGVCVGLAVNPATTVLGDYCLVAGVIGAGTAIFYACTTGVSATVGWACSALCSCPPMSVPNRPYRFSLRP